MTNSTLIKVAPGQGISCHAWNKDRSMVAVCPNANYVVIYKVKNVKDMKTWEQIHELREHDQLVSGIDWAPNTNRIVTVSHDRNAYVWTFETVDGTLTWKPTLVILRMSRAATCVKWTADEQKFAVGSGAQCIAICSYDDAQNWWTSKLIRKHGSTVLSLDWHPSSPYIASGCADNRCRIMMAYIKDVDSKEFGKVNPFSEGEGKRPPFGEVVHEFKCNGWVHCVRWSPSGNRLAFCSHDSVVSIFTIGSGLVTVKLSCLPFRSLIFLSDSVLVGVGHDLNPLLLKESNGQWSVAGKLDKEEVKVEAQQSAAKAAMAMFQNQAKKATADTDSTDLATHHQNSVSGAQAYQAGSSFTSTGLDGHMVLWDLGSSLEAAIAQLKL